MDKKQKFYFYSFFSTCVGGINSVLSTDASLYALNKNSKITQNYVYKNITGQTIGLGLTLLMKDKIKGNEYTIALTSIFLQQLSITLDQKLYKSPHKYLLYKSISGGIKNMSWILLGSVNVKCITKLLEKDKKDDITSIYSELSIINTIGASCGLYVGNHVVSKLNIKSMKYISPILCLTQMGFYYKLLNTVI